MQESARATIFCSRPKKKADASREARASIWISKKHLDQLKFNWPLETMPDLQLQRRDFDVAFHDFVVYRTADFNFADYGRIKQLNSSFYLIF
jgi:hypothetical protein